HVYCEKPLTHTISEARQILSETKKRGVVTQMGNQIHSGTNYRRVVELVQSGAIGEVHEVHVWVDGTWQTKPRPVDIVPVPADLNYEMWLGPAQYRPYHPEYLPFNWRRWWAFGGGTMADFGCHFMDLPHWALKLGHPLSVTAEGPEVDPECAPPWMIARYEHPAREDMPPVTLTWYQGGKRPRYFEEGVLPKWGSGVLFVGAKGMLIADYSKHLLLPESKFTGFVPPQPFIPDSIGHHAEWISACKHGGPTGSDFRYAAVLTEAVCLGNVAFRTGKRIEWDSINMKATGCPEADEFIQHDYRRGWRL
ncbi:MAG TPA: gfo/Idh/MocA family oxidoreductase, partial [Roseimicrobium sp.]|nr:gfo/Idh/MocA family oxidoreductase [Roseimicrobium sp.]